MLTYRQNYGKKSSIAAVKWELPISALFKEIDEVAFAVIEPARWRLPVDNVKS